MGTNRGVNVFRLITLDGYMDEFSLFLASERAKNNDISNGEVFAIFEDIFFEAYGVHKYSDYGSFRASKSRYDKTLILKKINSKIVNNVNKD